MEIENKLIRLGHLVSLALIIATVIISGLALRSGAISVPIIAGLAFLSFASIVGVACLRVCAD